MTNTNQISADSYTQSPYSWKDWSAYLADRSKELLLISVAQIIPLGVLTAISAVLSYVLVRLLFQYNSDAFLLYLLALAVPAFCLIGTVIMILGVLDRKAKKVIWLAGIPILTMVVLGVAWLLFNLTVIAFGENDREILESINTQYAGKTVTLAYDGGEYSWNGELADGILNDSMEMSLKQDVSSGTAGILSLTSSDPVSVVIDGAEEEHLLFQSSTSQNLYVRVNSCEIDVFLEMEQVQ